MSKVVLISKKELKRTKKAPQRHAFWEATRKALLSRKDKIMSTPRPALFKLADFRKPLLPTGKNKAGVLIDDIRGLVVIRDGSRHRFIEINDENAVESIKDALRVSSYFPGGLIYKQNQEAGQRQAMEAQQAAAASPLSMAGLSGTLGLSLAGSGAAYSGKNGFGYY